MNKRIEKKTKDNQQVVWLSAEAHKALKEYSRTSGIKMSFAASKAILATYGGK